jgi:hypothetical protein
VIGSEQMKAVGEKILCPMREVILGFSGNDAGVKQVGEVSIEGDLSKTDDDANTWQCLDLSSKVGGAVANLLGQGLVARWSTADDGGDPGMAKLEAVIAMDGSRLAGQAKFVQYGIHEVARAIASEGAASPVGAVCAGGKAEDQDARARVAEAGNGTRPVGLIQVGTAFRFADAAAVVAKAGTALTGDDGVTNLMKEWGRILCVERCHCI